MVKIKITKEERIKNIKERISGASIMTDVGEFNIGGGGSAGTTRMAISTVDLQKLAEFLESL